MLSLVENLFFYTECVYCNSVDAICFGQNLFCGDCLSTISKEDISHCKSCGKKTSANLCGSCGFETLFDEIRIFSKYEGVLREVILEYKFNKNKNLSKFLGQIINEDLINFVKERGIDIVLYPPSSKKKEKERGFNHLKEILLNTKLNKAIIKDFLVKIKNTPLQVELSSDERRINLQDAFIVKNINQLEGKRVLIFDDILTTGSTLKEALRAVRKAKPENLKKFTGMW